MIEEQFVSFDTAKLLKEAGFDVPIYKHYTKTGAIWTSAMPEKCNDKMDYMCFPCPTQALVARWLREVHNLHVYAIQTNLPLTEPQTDEWEWGYLITKINDPNGGSIFDMNFTSYEKALEAGLQEAIKQIKK